MAISGDRISSAWDFGGKDIWDYILPERIKNHGPEIADPAKRAAWCQALFYGGNSLRLWNEAVELKTAFLSACALREGQNIFLIGKYAEESGLAAALRSLIRPKGKMSLEEIGPRAVAAYNGANSTKSPPLRWDFDCLNSLPDESLDRVILFGAASHVRNWKACARQTHRVLRDGGRVIIADAPWGGKELLTAAHMESHLGTILTALLSAMRINEEDLIFEGPDELKTIFKPFLRWDRAFSNRGLYLFYGQKGGKKKDLPVECPASTKAVQAFLTEKPSASPWDFLATAEIAALGQELVDVDKQKKWGKVISYGASCDYAYEHASGVLYPMYTNLKVKPGDKVLVIGEWLDRLFLPEIRRRVGKDGEVVVFDLHTFRSLGIKDIGPKITNYDFMDFANRYLTFPDNYFDLIWLPQGVHHVVSWKEFAPKLLRVLKPESQLMMLEWRHPADPFLLALSISGLLKCIADKIYWAAGHAFQDIPDVPTADLVEALGDSLNDIYRLEWNGFLLFWGYKK
jgi:ubiquinone/menaquinone biosynthesis C-methylase UbiE